MSNDQEQEKEDLKKQLQGLMDKIDQLEKTPEPQGEKQIKVPKKKTYTKGGVEMEELPEEEPPKPQPTPSQSPPAAPQPTPDPVQQFMQQSGQQPAPLPPQQPPQQAPSQINQQQIEQMRRQDQQFIHKRVCATEVYNWISKLFAVLLVDIVAMFLIYFFCMMFLFLFAQVVVAAAIIFTGWYMIKIKKHKQYLEMQYQIASKKGMLSTIGKPKFQRQQQPRQPYPPQQQPQPPAPPQQYPPQQYPPQQYPPQQYPPQQQQPRGIRNPFQKQHYDQGERRQ